VVLLPTSIFNNLLLSRPSAPAYLSIVENDDCKPVYNVN
jgi:hypothetical protein